MQQQADEEAREPEVCYVWFRKGLFDEFHPQQHYLDEWPQFAFSPQYYMSPTLDRFPELVALEPAAFEPWLVIDKKAMWPVGRPEEEDLEAES